MGIKDVNSIIYDTDFSLGRKGLLPLTYGLIQGIFCYETAAFLNGMSMFGDSALYMYCPEITEPINIGAIIYYPTEYGFLDYMECTKRAEGVYVTDPLRTIRELIAKDAYYEQVCECLDWWNRENGSLGYIILDLEQYGLQDKLQQYLDFMPTYGFEYKLWEE